MVTIPSQNVVKCAAKGVSASTPRRESMMSTLYSVSACTQASAMSTIDRRLILLAVAVAVPPGSENGMARVLTHAQFCRMNSMAEGTADSVTAPSVPEVKVVTPSSVM